MILNSEYECMFFDSCIDLKFFDDNNSFYKVFVLNNINNPKKMEYEM